MFAPNNVSTRRIKPKHQEWVPWDYQKRAVDFLLDRGAAALFLDPGLGKYQCVKTMIYTPNGWVKMGDLRIGGMVYSVDGEFTRVIGVFPQKSRENYKITFADRSSTNSGPEHLWTVARTSHSAQLPIENTRAWKTLTLQQIMDEGVLRPKPCGRKGAFWRIPITDPVQHPEANLPIAPYILGALLGDGYCCARYTTHLSVSDSDKDIHPRVHQLLEGVAHLSWRQAKGCRQVNLMPAAYWRSNLSKLNLRVKSKDKFIPEVYKRSSVEQRTELLRGLMDTDGSCIKNRVTFHTTSPQLAKDVAELVRSLGGVAIERWYKRAVGDKPAECQISVKTTFCPFHTARKKAEWSPHKLSRIIHKVERAPDTDQVCIKVAHPTGLYLTENFIVTHNTSIVLETFKTLKEEGTAKHMLVIAPLRVCQLVWRQEGKKWTQFRDLTFSLVHGTKKAAALAKEADIYLINPEGVAWLTDQLWGASWPFDTVVIDELTKFKNGMAVRHKKLFPFIKKAKRRWGLTGTPIPNGYLDLFGQMKILDDGIALGFYYSHFRNKYFEKDYTGFNYNLRRGSQKAIEAAIKAYVLRMAADDYLDLPKQVDDIITVEMPLKARLLYNEMKKEMEVELAEGLVEAGNAAAVYSKLKQMANGAVYSGDGVFEKKKVLHLHDAKIDALMDLVEEMNGQPILVAYEFNHDLKRLQEVLGNVPYLGAGVSGKKAQRIEKDWNANRIPVMLAHPASAGHGLNFQGGNASHIAWFSTTWDYELYDQFIKRVLRQGNQSTHVINHILIVEDTIDNKTMDVIESKGLRQDAFCDALNAEIYHGGKTEALPDRANEEKDTTMVRKLSRRNKAETEEEPEEEETPRRSRRATRSSRRTEEPEEETPRQSSRSGSKRKLRGETDEDAEEENEEAPVSKRARSKFSKAVRGRLDAEPSEETPEVELFPCKKAPAKEAGTAESGSVTELALSIVRRQLEEGDWSVSDLSQLAYVAMQLEGCDPL